MVDSNQLIAQFTKLERAVGEWEPKIESLMKSNPTDLHVSMGPDPYTAEVEVQTQRLELVRIDGIIVKQVQQVEGCLSALSITLSKCTMTSLLTNKTFLAEPEG